MKEEVELHPAYQWDCPDCGRESFERIIVPETDDGWWSAPMHVKCDYCKSSFVSYDQFDEEPDDFDPNTDTGPMETNI